MQEYLKSIEGTLLANAGLVLICLLVTIVGSIVVKFVVRKILDRTTPASAGFIASIVQVAVVIGGMYATAIFGGVNPSIILAIIAIASAGISLSADATFKDVIAGAKIVGNSKLKAGEWVTVSGGIYGRITEVGLSSTTIASPLTGLVTLANHRITEEMVVNHSRLRNLEYSINFPFYDAHDRTFVTDTIIKVVSLADGVDPASIIVHSWTGSGQNYEVILTIQNYENRRQIASRISLAITKALEAEKQPIGYATFFKNI